MRKIGLFLLAFICFVNAGAASKEEDAAASAATAWLHLVDSGQYVESWQQSASSFQVHVTKEAWAEAATQDRVPFGAVKSRSLKSAKYTTSLPGAPDGQYVVVQFETQFEKKQHAVETITPMLEGGTWRVSGYYVQ